MQSAMHNGPMPLHRATPT